MSRTPPAEYSAATPEFIGSMSPASLAWIGLGNMGIPMVRNIVKSAEFKPPMRLFNRTKTAEVDKLVQDLKTKAVLVDRIQDTLKADIIFTCTSGEETNIRLLTQLGKNSLKNKLVVDCSTLLPATTEKIEELVTEYGGKLVAAPVFGAPYVAAMGSLLICPAGPAAEIERIRPYAEAVSRNVIELPGEPCKNATLLKVLSNNVTASMILALAESYVLAEKTGLGAENLFKFVEAQYPGVYPQFSRRMLDGQYHKAAATQPVELLIQATTQVEELGNDSGVAARLAPLIRELAQDLAKEKGDRVDVSGLYGVKRLESGLPYEP